ncbi:MAG: hypothetical protein ACFFF9_01235 [Candidatus Thorarchaeota archaeon]
MQAPPTLEMAILGVPGVLIGLGLGYYFGGYERFRAIDRIGMGIISSIFAGVITAFLIMNYWILLTTFEVIFIVLSYFGGYVLGAVSNWAPTPEKPKESHIIHEPDDDDEAFDREIEDALSGKYKSNKS